MLSLILCAIVCVLLLPVAAGIALVWQSVLGSLLKKDQTVEQAALAAGWINSTVLVYVIALYVYFAFN